MNEVDWARDVGTAVVAMLAMLAVAATPLAVVLALSKLRVRADGKRRAWVPYVAFLCFLCFWEDEVLMLLCRAGRAFSESPERGAAWAVLYVVCAFVLQGVAFFACAAAVGDRAPR